MAAGGFITPITNHAYKAAGEMGLCPHGVTGSALVMPGIPTRDRRVPKHPGQLAAMLVVCVASALCRSPTRTPISRTSFSSGK
jgi:hypothetical protein